MNDASRISCLVYAGNTTRRASLVEMLGQDARVSLIDQAGDSDFLGHLLSRHHYELIVVAPVPGLDALPETLQSIGDSTRNSVRDERATRILVVPPLGNEPAAWFERGATDVVGLPQPETVRHAIERLIDDRAGVSRLRETLRRLGDERALSDTLFATHPHGLALLREEDVLRANHRFDDLIGAKNGRSSARGLRWRGWLDAESSHSLASLERGSTSALVLGTRSGGRYHARVAPVSNAHDSIRLLTIDPQPLETPLPGNPGTDPATGLMLRDALVRRFEEVLVASRASRSWTAMRVMLPDAGPEAPPDGVGRTYEDLLILRAAEALRQRFRGGTLLGRSGRNTLLVVQPGLRGEASRELAGRVRETLGSLGGYLERPSAVRIDTLTLQARSLSARDVVERLERRSA